MAGPVGKAFAQRLGLRNPPPPNELSEHTLEGYSRDLNALAAYAAGEDRRQPRGGVRARSDGCAFAKRDEGGKIAVL